MLVGNDRAAMKRLHEDIYAIGLDRWRKFSLDTDEELIGGKRVFVSYVFIGVLGEEVHFPHRGVHGDSRFESALGLLNLLINLEPPLK